MVRRCSVKFCRREWTPDAGTTFFSFPIKNDFLANQWRKVVPCNVTLGKSAQVCSEHFNESDFVYFGPRRGLKKGAVPSIFPADPHLVPENDCHNPESALHLDFQEQVGHRGSQAAIQGVDQRQACSPVYERHGNTVPDIPLPRSKAPQNGQDHDSDAVPEPSQGPHRAVTQMDSDMEMQIPQKVKYSFVPESVLHPGLQPRVRHHEPPAVILGPEEGQTSTPRAYERHGTVVPDTPLSQPRYYDVHQILNDMEVQEHVDTAHTAEADTPMVLIDLTDDNFSKKINIQNKQKMVPKEVHDEKMSAMTRRIRILQARLRRREARLSNVTTMLKLLKRKGKCTDDLEHVLLRRFGGFNLELFRNELKNDACAKTGKRYTKQMKQFASTIYFYSPKTYKFLRTKLNLPNEATLRKMIGEATCEAGFVEGVFHFLKGEAFQSDFLKNVGLIVDGMSIRSQLSVDQKENSLCGQVDYGKDAEKLNLIYDRSQFATEMLAFQIVSYSHKFKIAIAHFFVKGVTADNQAKLIDLAVKKLYDVGVVVRSVTCDGTSTNLNTLEKLGCDFNVIDGRKPVTSFKHPVNGNNIYAVLDPCHMLKLCRNSFAECALESSDGLISFKYLEELNKLQENEGFKFRNRLTRNHIKYGNKKMKVSLAAQTISSGVADAIDYLRQSGCLQFKGSEATCMFLRTFDMLFDMLNSRSAFGTGFKSPISLKNIEHVREKFETCEKYIRQLKWNGKFVTDTKRKAFAIGLLVEVHSVYGLANDLLRNIQTPLKYFLSYKCSQDHIELYFCCIRSRGGWNNNPTVLQALWAIRRLLFRNSVTPSVNANCLGDESEPTSILEFRSSKRTMVAQEEEKDDCTEITDLMSRLEHVNLSSYQENIIYYITGYLVQQIIKKCTCSYCLDILTAPLLKVHSYAAPNLKDHSGFSSFVNRGKLCMPSTIAFEMVKYCEKAFKSEIDIGFYGAINFKCRLTSIAVAHFSTKFSLFYPPHPVIDTINIFENQREIQLIKCIAAKYCQITSECFCQEYDVGVFRRKIYHAPKTIEINSV